MSTQTPLIGITTYSPDAAGEYHVEREYVESVRRAGGVPVLLPPGGAAPNTLFERLDGIILTGGGDIDPAHYASQGHAMIYGIEPERDVAELAIAAALRDSTIPALCVCRGAQILNVAWGGTLVEDIPDLVGEDVEHRQTPPGATFHPIYIKRGSHLDQILNSELISAASWHHQSIRTVADGLVITGMAPDGVVEAVECPAHPWLVAIQWHPEMTAATDPIQQRIFDALINAARNR